MVRDMRADLERRHPFAAERVGFVFARMGNQGAGELQVLPTSYAPVPDANYIEDSEVGARIDSTAIRAAMQTVLGQQLGAFHVHMHDHRGQPRFSRVDLADYPALVRSFQNVAPGLAHGALLLSEDSCECLVWLPGGSRPSPRGRIIIVGNPMGVFPEAGLYG